VKIVQNVKRIFLAAKKIFVGILTSAGVATGTTLTAIIGTILACLFMVIALVSTAVDSFLKTVNNTDVKEIIVTPVSQ